MGSPAEIVLEYRRVDGLSNGELYLRKGEEHVEQSHFKGISFDAMLYSLARKLQEHREAEVFFLRSDRPGAVPYRLDHATIDLLRADPVAAVQAMTYPGSPATLFRRAQERVRPARPVLLHAGFDILADAFGTRVYCRMLNGDLECPGCGYWSPFAGDVFRCKKRCRIEIAALLEGRWASVLVADLLATSERQFYLPRHWNPGPWITKEQLESLYQAFLKEKETVTCSILQPTP